MITKNDILHMVRSVYRASHGKTSRRLIHPARTWGWLVLTSGVACIGVGLGTMYVFYDLNQMERNISPTEVETVTYEDTTVTRALELINERTVRYEALQAAVVIPAAAPATSTATSTAASAAAVSTATSSESTADAPAEAAELLLSS